MLVVRSCCSKVIWGLELDSSVLAHFEKGCWHIVVETLLAADVARSLGLCLFLWWGPHWLCLHLHWHRLFHHHVPIILLHRHGSALHLHFSSLWCSLFFHTHLLHLRWTLVHHHLLLRHLLLHWCTHRSAHIISHHLRWGTEKAAAATSATAATTTHLRPGTEKATAASATTSAHFYNLIDFFFTWAISGLAKLTVNNFTFRLEILLHHLLLLRSHNLLLELPIITLHDGLSLADVSSTSHLCALHYDILLHKAWIDVGLKLFSLARRLHLLCNYSEALWTIQSCVFNLSLEGEMRDSGHVNIHHLKQLGEWLHSILKSKDSFSSCVTKSACKKWLVSWKVSIKLISELKTLVQLDLSFNVCGNNRDWKHCCKIFRKGGWVDTLNSTACKLGKGAESIKIAFITFDWDNIDGNTGFAGKLSNILIESLSSLSLFFSIALVPGTKTDVCKTISADDDSRTSRTFCSHGDWSNNTWAQSSRSCLFNLVEFGFKNFLSGAYGLCQTLGSLSLAVVLKPFIVRQVVTRDCLSILRAITNDLYFMIESDNSNLSLTSSVSHVGDLRVNGSFDTLNSWNISHSTIRCVHKLIRTITKLSHLSL